MEQTRVDPLIWDLGEVVVRNCLFASSASSAGIDLGGHDETFHAGKHRRRVLLLFGEIHINSTSKQGNGEKKTNYCYFKNKIRTMEKTCFDLPVAESL